MTHSILLIGGGGHCIACIDVLEAEAKYRIEGIVEAKTSKLGSLSGYHIVGFDENLPDLLSNIPRALITVGQIKSPTIRIRLFNLLKNYGAELPVIISPVAYCSSRAEVSEGTILMHGSVVNAGAIIAENCIINSQALIEHGVQIAAHCHISTGARINGDVRIGAGSFVGSGAIIREGIEIGDSVIIGAGQIVLKNVPSGAIIKAC